MDDSDDLKKVRELQSEELELPDPDAAAMPLAHSLSVRVSWLNSAIEHQTNGLLDRLASITMLEWRCLATLCVRGPKTGQEIASLCNVSAPQASRGLRALGSKGYVAWEAGSERRSFGPARVSDEGRALYDKVAPVMASRNRWLLSDLSAKERRDLFRLLATVRKRVAEGATVEDLIG